MHLVSHLLRLCNNTQKWYESWPLPTMLLLMIHHVAGECEEHFSEAGKRVVDKTSLWPLNVCMWVMENLENMFYYQEHSLLDINSQVQNDSPFTLGVQSEWQLQMMVKFGHISVLSIDASFGTNQTRVSQHSLSFINIWCHSMSFKSWIVFAYHIFCRIMLLMSRVGFAISALHNHGIWWMEKWHICCVLRNILHSRTTFAPCSSSPSLQSSTPQVRLVSFVDHCRQCTGKKQHIEVLMVPNPSNVCFLSHICPSYV